MRCTNRQQVEYIEQDTIVKVSLDGFASAKRSSITQVSSPWGFARISSIRRGSNDYRNGDSAGLGTCVYVVDTGVATSHPEFEGRAVFLANFAGDSLDTDGYGHGTHCAGIVGSKT